MNTYPIVAIFSWTIRWYRGNPKLFEWAWPKLHAVACTLFSMRECNMVFTHKEEEEEERGLKDEESVL